MKIGDTVYHKADNGFERTKWIITDFGDGRAEVTCTNGTEVTHRVFPTYALESGCDNLISWIFGLVTGLMIGAISHLLRSI